MSANAEAIVEQIKNLTADEFVEVRDAIRQIVETHQREALERLHGSGKGEGLVDKLLEYRAADLAFELKRDAARAARAS